MKNDLLYENFISAIKDRIPERGRLTNKLADFLCIEKEAIYRRLRGEVPFTFSEIVTIAIELGISLDSVAEGVSPVSRPLNMRLLDYFHPVEEDYNMIDNFSKGIQSLVDDPNSESGAISSIIPTSLCVKYRYIYKFYLFKWLHQFGEEKDLKPYTEIEPVERLIQSNEFFVDCVHRSPRSVYIIDKQMIAYFVEDVRFFAAIRLLKNEDVLLIKEDLHEFLNDLERYANNGTFDLGGKVSIYLANVHFEANYNYVDAKDYKITMIRSFTFSDAYSFDEHVFQNMKSWTQFLKRSSILISESGEIQRILFFEKQRELVDSL